MMSILSSGVSRGQWMAPQVMRTATFPPTGAPWYFLARRTKFRTSTLPPPTEAASLGGLLARPEPFCAGLPTESGYGGWAVWWAGGGTAGCLGGGAGGD